MENNPYDIDKGLRALEDLVEERLASKIAQQRKFLESLGGK